MRRNGARQPGRGARAFPPESPYPGICRINRAEVETLRGAWPAAEAEASRASTELMSFDPIAAAQAFYGTGEIRRRMGNFAGAEESFARAHEIGFDPQPGLALLRLAQGKAEAARTGLRLALSGETGSRMRRARLLAAQVDVALAMSDVETARTASAELDAIVAGYSSPALDATAATARGALRLAEDDVSGALDGLRHAITIWQELRMPYEAAGARTRYALALRTGRREGGCRPGAPGCGRRLRSAGCRDRCPSDRRASRGTGRPPARPDARGRSRCSGWSPPGSRTARSPPSS